jgi:tellurite resistance protein TerC
VASLVRKLRFLKSALALVLAFVGVKMLITDRFPIPDWISLSVVAGLIIGASVVSLIFPAPPEPDRPRDDADEPSEPA